MHRRTHALAAVALSSAILAAPCTLPAASAAVPLKVLNVQLADLPAGSYTIANRSLTPAELAKENNMPVAQLLAEGFDALNEADFGRNAPAGIVSLSSTVERWNTDAAAEVELLMLRNRYRAAFPGAKTLSVGLLGDARFGFTRVQVFQGHTLTQDTLGVRQGHYVQFLIVDGVVHTLRLGDVLPLSRIMLARIRANG